MADAGNAQHAAVLDPCNEAADLVVPTSSAAITPRTGLFTLCQR